MNACHDRGVLRRIAPALGVAGLLAAVLPMAGFALFLAGFGLPRTVDSGAGSSPARAMAVDLGLLLFFAAAHSGLARPRVKTVLTRWVPAELERTLYSLVAGTQITLLLILWQPIPELVWSAGAPVARALLQAGQATGWLLVLASLATIGPGHLFGRRQAASFAAGRRYEPPPITVRGPYHWLRHPLYTGTAVALFSAPDMSRGRLLLATVLSVYMLLGMQLEERELARRYGDRLLAYRQSVPGLLQRLASLYRRDQQQADAVGDPDRPPHP
jgi:protein-S-isoprenylcysteine O-methyltransferase Ste14